MKNTPHRAIALLAACVALLALAACGATKIEAADVAGQVKGKSLEPVGITGATVKCPAETEAKKGAKIKCDVTDDEDNKGLVTATVQDEEGKLGGFEAELADLQRAVVLENANEEAGSKGVTGEVKCPGETEPKKGAVYFCTGQIRGSGTGVVLVSQKSEKGDVSVRVQRRKLRTAQIERNISKEVQKQGIDANVDCPDRVTSQKGSTFDCTVRNPANGKQITIVATQKDDRGNFNLKVK